MFDVTGDDGTRHRLWRCRTGHDEVAAALGASTVLVADGHHRYETALRYERERGAGDERAAFLPVYLANADDGLVIYPTHRIVSGVADDVAAGLADALRAQGLDVREVDDPVAALAEVDGRAALAVVREGRPALLAEGGDGVDSALAQDHLLGPILGLDAAAVARTDRITYSYRPSEAIGAGDRRPDRDPAARADDRAGRGGGARRRGRCRRSRPTSTRRRSTASCSTASTTAPDRA